MDLKNIPDEHKIKAFNMIIDEYRKDTDISQFGRDVQEILKFLKKFNEFK